MKLHGKGIFPEIGFNNKNKEKDEDIKQKGFNTMQLQQNIELKDGRKFHFLIDPSVPSSSTQILVSNKDLIDLVNEGDTIFVDCGPTFSVTKCTNTYVDTIIKKGGELKGNDELSIYKKVGFIDYYVNSDLQFGFEFLIDGILRSNHYNRFCLNGDYSFLKLKNFQLIDFTTSQPQKDSFEKYKGITFVYFHDKEF